MKHNAHQDLTIRYALIQAFFWISFSAITGFASPFLLDSGFSNSQIGFIIAAGGIFSAIFQPMLASFADIPQSPSIKKILIALSGILLGFSILLLVIYKNSMIVTGLFFGACITVLQLLTPFINSLGIESLNQGKNLNYGISRGVGSLSFAIESYILGIIVTRFGTKSIPVIMILTFVFLIFALIFFPFMKVTKKEDEKNTGEHTRLLSFFIKYKRFSVVLAGSILIYISHSLLNSFIFQIIRSKGGSNSEMGTAMALAALVELPTMFFFDTLVKKVRCDILFRISGIFFTVKALGSQLAPSVFSFYLVQILQTGGWALNTVSSVYYVNSIMEEQDVIKGQAYMTMAYTIGSVIGALVGGVLIDGAGVNAMLLFSTIMALTGTLIIIPACQKTVNS